MGSCCCRNQESFIHEILDAGHHSALTVENRNVRKSYRSYETDTLVLEALTALRKLADDDDEPPECMAILHSMAEEDEGWLNVVKSCIFAIPLEDSLGSAVVSLLLDECPLPTRDAIQKLISHLNLNKDLRILKFHTKTDKREAAMVPYICRNLAIVLGCLAEKLAGASSKTLLTKGTLDFLLSKLRVDEHPAVVLYTILALEKFAQTSENKFSLKENGVAEKLEVLEKELLNSPDQVKHQAGFCAQWTLDNIFFYEGRAYSYQVANVSHVNAMLNSNDSSDYLKISATGLEARCDATSFESVRCTFCVEEGVWYYEVTILTAGVMQIGWATKDSKFLNHDGYGIGDDEFSCAYDGCRQLIWHAAKSIPHDHPPWKPGDVLGLLLDLEKGKVVFSLNGRPVERDFPAARTRFGGGFFAAASFMSFQHCLFNFGSEPFKYQPKVVFRNINDNAKMTAEEKIILPRHQKLAATRQESVSGDPCSICFEKVADTRLEPCGHRDLCMRCAKMMNDCPICRQPIVDRVLECNQGTSVSHHSRSSSQPSSPS